jgi:hypothetical protein
MRKNLRIVISNPPFQVRSAIYGNSIDTIDIVKSKATAILSSGKDPFQERRSPEIFFWFESFSKPVSSAKSQDTIFLPF